MRVQHHDYWRSDRKVFGQAKQVLEYGGKSDIQTKNLLVQLYSFGVLDIDQSREQRQDAQVLTNRLHLFRYTIGFDNSADNSVTLDHHFAWRREFSRQQTRNTRLCFLSASCHLRTLGPYGLSHNTSSRGPRPSQQKPQQSRTPFGGNIATRRSHTRSNVARELNVITLANPVFCL